jgi:hypothetical protein
MFARNVIDFHTVYSKTSRLVLGPSAPYSIGIGVLSLTLKLPGHEADHQLPPSAEVKDEWS